MIEENDYEKYRKETPIGSPFDKNHIPKKFSSSEVGSVLTIIAL